MSDKKIAENSPSLRNFVYQSNPLINSRKIFDLLGLRIFLLGLRGLNPHFSAKDKFYDKDFPVIFIPTGKLTELFGNTKYLAELKPTCRKLFNATIELNYSDGGFSLQHLFDKLDYEPGEGLSLQFNHCLHPYLLDLFQTTGYTRINVDYLFKLSSPYSVRLLELLLQYQNIDQFKSLMEIKRKMTVEEIKFSLNVPEGAYSKRIGNFRKYVLDNPIKEINAKTPYVVRYTTVKKGRNVVAFEFTMDTSNAPKDKEEYKRSADAIRALRAMGFSEKVAIAIFAKCLDEADCFSRINRAQAILDRSKRPIANELGFLRKAIEENWQVRREYRRVERTDTYSRSYERTSSDDSMTSIGEILKSTVLQLKEKFLKNSAKSGKDNIPDKPKEDSVPDKPKEGRAPDKPKEDRVPDKPKEDRVPDKPKENRVPDEPKPPIYINGKKIQHGLAQTFMKHIRNGDRVENVESFLNYYNISLESFIETCMKRGI